jgi:hypothetical protein
MQTKRSERTIVYSALALLGAMNVVFLLSHSGQAALAESAAFIADVIGPAEAVKLTDGDKELEVRAKGGRVAWGEGEFRQTYSIAFVDSSRALNPMMDGPQYVEEREALAKELEEKENDYRARLEAFKEKLPEDADQNDPAIQEAMTQARALYEEYMEWGRGAIGRRDALDVQHMQRAYRDLTSAVDVVANRLGVDIVLRFIPTESEFKAEDAEGALTEIRLRSAVKYPAALDITSEVLQELGVQDQG